jgi:class 3 adenylate cyclase/pimeloyl-ACP methyl ester carboxylesterase
MEPQIQYVTTKDGVSIAYYAIGQGPAALFMMSPWSHLTAEWEIDYLRMAYTAAAQQVTLIRLDPRGHGHSDRAPPDFNLDSMVLDIEAVIDRVAPDSLVIQALGFCAVPALVYTSRHPELVTRFAQEPPATGPLGQNDRLDKLVELAEIDWELGSETVMRSFNPEWPDQQIKAFAGLVRQSIDFEVFQRLIDAEKAWNADAEAAAISTPTLLIHDRQNSNMDEAQTRRVASLIKNSRVHFANGVLEGQLAAQQFLRGDSAGVQQPAFPPAGTPADTGGFRTILFTDIEGSTALTDRLGDAAAREVLREHERITREALKAHGGSEVKTMGDGFMASFGSATRALECAIAIQNAAVNDSIRVRCGLNAGEPIAEDDDLFGTAVIVAARIAAQAHGGEILVSDVVRQLVAGKGFLFNDRGEHALKGFEDPVRVFEVSWSE